MKVRDVLAWGSFKRPERGKRPTMWLGMKRPTLWLGITGRFPHPRGLCLYWRERGYYFAVTPRPWTWANSRK